jgi:Ca-activated chloride channel family protein
MQRVTVKRLLALAVSAIGVAQTPASRSRSIDIHVQSDLVLINASVTDSRGRPIIDLDASRFHILEDGKEQVIKSCSGEDVPVSIGLVLDTSGSMSAKVGLLKQAAIQFVRAANPYDGYFLVEFQQTPRVVLPFTTDIDQVLEAIGRMEAGGSTPLFDAVHLAVGEMRHSSYPRKALLIVSDGIENHSRYTQRETTRLISEVDFPIYTINLWERQRDGNRYAIQRRDPAVLETISTPTGGRDYPVLDLKKLASTTDLISLAIRHEYVLGYAPSDRRYDGKLHKVTVKVEPSPGQHFKISNRAGYYDPIR